MISNLCNGFEIYMLRVALFLPVFLILGTSSLYASFDLTETEQKLKERGLDHFDMPSLKIINAQRVFTQALDKRNRELKNYASNLNEYHRDLILSLQRNADEITSLITEELEGKIENELGFATDYIAPSSPYRKQSLNSFMKFLEDNKKALNLQLGCTKYVQYNYTQIEFIVESFSASIALFKSLVESYPTSLERMRNFVSLFKENMKSQHLPVTLIDLAIQAFPPEAFLMTRHFLLMFTESREQECRIFLPLINFMMSDKTTKNMLEHHDLETFKTIQDLLRNYNIYRTQLKTYLEEFARDRTMKTLLPVQQKIIKLIPEKKEQKIEPSKIAPNSKAPKETLNQSVQVRTNRPARKAQPVPTIPHTNQPEQAKEDPLINWLMARSSAQGHKITGKSDYRTPSDQEKTLERKQKAKEAKRANVQPLTTEEKEPKSIEAQVADTSVIFYLSGNFDVFESIMKETYKGEMKPIKLLIKDRFKGMAYLTDGRWHFGIPHISANHGTAYSLILDPLEDTPESPIVTNEITEKLPRTATTVHNPHKNGEKRLRSYHVRDIKKMFERGGYTLDTVKDIRKDTL